MKLRNPLNWIDIKQRKRVFLILILLIFLFFLVFQQIGKRIVNEASPFGIVSFELAGTPQESMEILESWNDQARLSAAFGLGLDFLFIPIYASAILLGCQMVSGKTRGWFSTAGNWIGWGIVLAGILDCVENGALWGSLSGNLSGILPMIAVVCAILKFGLILFGIIYTLIGWMLPTKKESSIQ